MNESLEDTIAAALGELRDVHDGDRLAVEAEFCVGADEVQRSQEEFADSWQRAYESVAVAVREWETLEPSDEEIEAAIGARARHRNAPNKCTSARHDSYPPATYLYPCTHSEDEIMNEALRAAYRIRGETKT